MGISKPCLEKMAAISLFAMTRQKFVAEVEKTINAEKKNLENSAFFVALPRLAPSARRKISHPSERSLLGAYSYSISNSCCIMPQATNVTP